jgi:hypothetical protein
MQVGRVITEPLDGLGHKCIISVNGLFKEAIDAKTGQLLKLQFRLLPQGHRVDKYVHKPEETTSPTVSVDTIFTVLNIAAYKQMKGFVMDILGAYLNPVSSKTLRWLSFPGP